MLADIDICRIQTRKVDMLSRARIARGNQTYRFSTTYTLSDFPLLNRRDATSERSPLGEESEMESAHSEDHRSVGNSPIATPEVASP
jgi:hypothetical protein